MTNVFYKKNNKIIEIKDFKKGDEISFMHESLGEKKIIFSIKKNDYLN